VQKFPWDQQMTHVLQINEPSLVCEGIVGSLEINFEGTPPWSITVHDGQELHTYEDIIK
jgi:hypothetical protein